MVIPNEYPRERMPSNFNRIAPFYDLLLWVVFGQRVWHAQRHFIDRVKPNDAVLILGGGTGKILDWLPADAAITYVEQSAAMIKRAKRRRNVTFVHADFRSFSTDTQYDWVICPFFLDCFDDAQLPAVLTQIGALIKPEGYLLVTDFRWTRQWYHRWLIRLMVVFFRISTKLRIATLQDIPEQLHRQGFKIQASRYFQNGLIFSAIYAR